MKATKRRRKEARTMEGFLFILGTIVIEGGLVALIMWLLTTGDREARREEEARRRLGELEAEEAGLRKAA
jgi:cbb3-type cytochrome oxidase subunit 3